MTVSNTKYYSIGRPAIGGSNNVWGEELNTALDTIDSAIYGIYTNTIQYSNKNYIINPCFLINQLYAGTSTILSQSTHFSDNWSSVIYPSADGELRYDLLSNLLGATGYNNRSKYGAKFTVITKDTLITAPDYYAIRTYIEGYNYGSLHRRSNLTLSFWVQSNKPGTYCVSFKNSANRSYVAEYSITNSYWNRKEITFIPDQTTTNWYFNDNNTGLRIDWTLACGSNYQLTSGVWHNTATYATPNQVNFLNTTTNNFRITQIKLEADTTASEFIERSFEDELLLCERYLEKSHNSFIPGDYSTITGMVVIPDIGDVNVNNRYFPIQCRVSKRSTPSANIYDNAGNTNTASILLSFNISATTLHRGQNCITMNTTSTSYNTGTTVYAHYVITSRMV